MNSEWLFGLIATYFVHSTILLGASWLILRMRRSATPAFENRWWKFAATAGFVTALAQTSVGDLAPFNLGNQVIARLSDLAKSQNTIDQLAKAEPAEPAPPTTSPLIEGNKPPSKWTVSTSLGPPPKPVPGEVVESNPPADATFLRTSASLSARTPEPAMPVGTSAVKAQRFAVFAAFVWGGCGLSWLLFRLARTHARVQTMPLATSGRVLRILEEVRETNDLRRRIDLRIDEEDGGEPIALGCFRWTIVLPRKAVDALSDDELRSVLSHELAHLVRGDYVWKLWGHLLCACAAFQPLNFVARRRWDRASECLSDQWAADHGASRLSLAKSLTRLAEFRQAPSSLLALTATGSRPMLVQRVERLLGDAELTDAWQSKWRIGLLNLIALLTTTVVILAAPSVQARSPKPRDQRIDLSVDEPSTAQDNSTLSIASETDESGDSDAAAWSRLDRELQSMLRDLETARELASASGTHANEIETLTAMAAAIEARRNQLKTQFGTGEE